MIKRKKNKKKIRKKERKKKYCLSSELNATVRDVM